MKKSFAQNISVSQIQMADKTIPFCLQIAPNCVLIKNLRGGGGGKGGENGRLTMPSLVQAEGMSGRWNRAWDPTPEGSGGEESEAAMRLMVSIHSCSSVVPLSLIHHWHPTVLPLPVINTPLTSNSSATPCH